MWDRRAEAKAAIMSTMKADNTALMMEEQLAMMLIDAVTDDGSVNLGCDGESGPENGIRWQVSIFVGDN